MKKNVLAGIILFICNFNWLYADTRQTVKIGGYYFPPFVEDKGDGQYAGITLEFIEAINSFQNKYKFQFVPTSAKRRYEDFRMKRYDMIMFESIEWEWKDKDVEASKVYLKDGGVYITKADPNKNQSYFDSLEGKSILIFLGYHYGFANFNADPEFLKQKFNATMTTTHEGNVNSVILGRADLAVEANSFLQKFLYDNPQYKGSLLVSDKFDTVNQYSILIRKNSKPGVEEINTLLTDMEKAGIFDKVWGKYGIK